MHGEGLHFLIFKTLFRDICPFGQSLLKPLYHSRISTKKKRKDINKVCLIIISKRQ